MSDLLFGWITKPKIEVTFLDDVVKVSEFLILLVAVAAALIFREERQRKKTRERHGKHCTCWTCMGVRR